MDYWQGANVKCGRHGMVRSVTEAQNHDEGRGGRSVTGVHGSATWDIEQKYNWGGMEKQVGIKV